MKNYLEQWCKAWKQRRTAQKRKDIISEVEDSIYIRNKVIKGEQSIALMVQGVVVDFVTAESKASDTQRLIENLVAYRNRAIEIQYIEEGVMP